MRISTAQIYNNLLSGVQKQLEVQDRGNAQVASGTRFQTPAEAGLDYKLSLDIRHSQNKVAGSIDAISTAETRLNVTQMTLTDMENILVRAETLAVQQSNAGIGAAERQAAAAEVGRLLDQFMSNANKRWQDQSLFSGTAVDRDAFAPDAFGNYVYNGSNQDRTVAVSATRQVSSNIRGDAPGFTNAISALESFRSALQANDTAAIQTALGELNAAGDGMTDLTSEVGGRLNYLQNYRASYEDMQYHLDRQLNTHEAVDMPAVVSELQQSSVALQAAYNQIAQLRSLSLTSFLR